MNQQNLFNDDPPVPRTLVIYTDGGARGNPGPAGFGVRVETPDGTLVEEFSGALGTATNNVAEYSGLIAGLEYASAHGATSVAIRSDSELMVRQMRGQYRVKNPGLLALYTRARQLASTFKRVSFDHVPRAQNAHADRLANLAMDSST